MITASKLLLKPFGLAVTTALSLTAGFLSACTPVATAPEALALTPQPPFLIIAHRGASGYRPEHTLAAYQLAIDQGADFIEPDLVPTRDGHLIARHENALAVVELTKAGELPSNGSWVVRSATTDVAERAEFAHLLTVREIDGRRVGGWFSEDSTLAQIKTLRARERIPTLRPANANYLDESIPSLQDVLALTRQPGNRRIGLYPELKHPTHLRYGRRAGEHSLLNIDTAQLLVDALQGSDCAQRLFIQCFEVETLRRLRHQLLPKAQLTGVEVKLVQLFGPMHVPPADVAYHQHAATFAQVYGPLAEPLSQTPSYAGLADVLPIIAADYANGVGPRKGDAKRLAKTSRALNLELHPYTVRAEAFFLSPLRGALADSVAGELAALQQLGATGVFIDQPDLAVSWRAAAARQTAPAPSVDRQDQ